MNPTCKKTGPQIEPTDYYRNGAGTARQEYHTLYGVNFVVGQLLIRLRPWPGEFVSLPIGLAVYLKEAKAQENRCASVAKRTRRFMVA